MTMKSFIKKLQNPKTEEYEHLKEIILSPFSADFTWRYVPTTNPDHNPSESRFSANPGYQHCVVARADVNQGFLVPRIGSQYVELVFAVIRQILDYNSIGYTQIHRCVISQIHYWDGKPSPPHIDHSFYHKNCLVYLNSFDDGNLDICDNNTKDCQVIETYKPYEDDIITFDGLYHSVNQPAPKQRRVVIVFTYS